MIKQISCRINDIFTWNKSGQSLPSTEYQESSGLVGSYIYSTGYDKTYQPLQLVEHYFQHLENQNRQL